MSTFKRVSNQAAVQQAVSTRKHGRMIELKSRGSGYQVQQSFGPVASDLQKSAVATPEHDLNFDLAGSTTSQDISSLDLKSLMLPSSNDDQSEGSPGRLLSFAYTAAINTGAGKVGHRLLKHYHKCLYALIKVLTKRMKLFYQSRQRTQ